ncbi:MAG: SAM-dependent methyltransferase [Flavobacteriaceae bacterium]|nr:SAM-dependent methyltransferase [Flavobacteriaceae bacterium]|tara:strand:+ start:9139 stop:9882 length:744 start_codon:yes stop_codon:yes gene_type:complete
MHNAKEWYSSWFDSPYYHSLYYHRNHQEASNFVSKLVDLIQPAKDAHFLDIACGRGRHAFELYRHGYSVTGIDLSPENIKYAKEEAKKKNASDTLQFMVHDMRKALDRQFSHVFNLFTSFGYFKDPKDNIRTLKSFRAQLAPNGVGVIDFLNPNWVLANLVKEENIDSEGIKFSIQRYTKDKWLYKDIQFQVDKHNYQFQEKVEMLEINDFITLFSQANLQLVDLFGDYQLRAYDKELSKRQILIFQ